MNMNVFKHLLGRPFWPPEVFCIKSTLFPRGFVSWVINLHLVLWGTRDIYETEQTATVTSLFCEPRLNQSPTEPHGGNRLYDINHDNSKTQNAAKPQRINLTTWSKRQEKSWWMFTFCYNTETMAWADRVKCGLHLYNTPAHSDALFKKQLYILPLE